MDAAYGQSYRRLYEEHWWWRARERYLIGELSRLQETRGRERILDIGCGDGLFFDRLEAFGTVEGIEPDASLVDPSGPHRSRIQVRPFDESFRPAEPYTLILLLDVLEHVEDPVRLLRHAATLLEPTGLFLITVPAFTAVWTRHDAINHHQTRYTRRTLRTVAAEAGVSLDRTEYWFQWTFPIRLAQALGERWMGVPVGSPSIPGPAVNSMLEWLSVLERRALRPLHPPFGTSLFALGAPRPRRAA